MKDQVMWQEKLFLKKAVEKKCREFQRQGYLGVEEEKLWEYLVDYRWLKEKPMNLKQKKVDVINILANEFFDYQYLKAQVDEAKKFSWDQIDDLL